MPAVTRRWNGKTTALKSLAGREKASPKVVSSSNFGIAVGKVLREVETSLVELDMQAIDATDELAARRTTRKIS